MGVPLRVELSKGRKRRHDEKLTRIRGQYPSDQVHRQRRDVRVVGKRIFELLDVSAPVLG